MLKKIGIGLAVFLVLVAGAGLVLPQSAHAAKSRVFAATPEQLYPQIASLKAWNEWSAWNTRADPKWQPVYSGPETGAGAMSTWTQSQSGAGTQTITAAEENRSVSYRIDSAESG